MFNYELYIPPRRYNKVNGQFCKGHVPWNKGVPMSEDTREKCAKTWFKKGHKSTRKYAKGGRPAKKIDMFKEVNGELRFIRTFVSMSETSRLTKVIRRNIGHNAEGRRNHAGGFVWKFHNE